jgi:hypothetical protein
MVVLEHRESKVTQVHRVHLGLLAQLVVQAQLELLVVLEQVALLVVLVHLGPRAQVEHQVLLAVLAAMGQWDYRVQQVVAEVLEHLA